MEMDYQSLLKILIFGEVGSGKASAIMKFTENKFEDAHITSECTNVRNKCISVDVYKLTMQIVISI